MPFSDPPEGGRPEDHPMVRKGYHQESTAHLGDSPTFDNVGKLIERCRKSREEGGAGFANLAEINAFLEVKKPLEIAERYGTLEQAWDYIEQKLGLQN